MPSPVAHAVAGLTAGWLVDGRPAARDGVFDPAVWKPAVLFAAAGMAADLDLLLGIHSGPTHGLGAAAIAALVVLAVTRRRRWALAAGAAYASHTLLDWLGTDTKAPIGIMALWPFSHAYYESSLHVFMGVTRQIHASNFWSYNLHAFARELLVLVPLLLAVAVLRRRTV